jgi:hypothetical protein
MDRWRDHANHCWSDGTPAPLRRRPGGASRDPLASALATPLGLEAGNVATTPPLRQCAIAKIFPFRPDPNQLYIPCRLVPSRGVSRSSRTRGGMRWTRQRQATPGDGRAGRKARELTNGTRTNGANADGKAVWFWHPLLVLNPWRRVSPTGLGQTLNPWMTVTRRIRRRGEREISR